MPAEAARFKRGIGRRDQRFLVALASAGAVGAAFAVFFVAHGGASTPRSGCVTLDQAGVMGGGTWRFCGADAAVFCLEHAAEDHALAERCRRIDRRADPD